WAPAPARAPPAFGRDHLVRPGQRLRPPRALDDRDARRGAAPRALPDRRRRSGGRRDGRGTHLDLVAPVTVTMLPASVGRASAPCVFADGKRSPEDRARAPPPAPALRRRVG